MSLELNLPLLCCSCVYGRRASIVEVDCQNGRDFLGCLIRRGSLPRDSARLISQLLSMEGCQLRHDTKIILLFSIYSAAASIYLLLLYPSLNQTSPTYHLSNSNTEWSLLLSARPSALSPLSKRL